MEVNNILNGGVAELNVLKGELEKQSEIRSAVTQSNVYKQQLEKQIAAEEKLVQDTINATIAKRKNEISKTFDKEISKEKDNLRGIKSRKEKAKNKGIRDRISSETSHLVEANKALHSEIRTAFGNKGIPKYCDSSWYYALFMPKSIKEILVFILVAIFLVIAFPMILVNVINGKWWLDIIVYVLTVMITAAIYVTIYLLTKDKDKALLVQMRAKRGDIISNEREIRRIKRAIKTDKDESMYNLGEYDSRIKMSEDTINGIVAKKNEALADFEQNTKNTIIQDITNQSKEKIEELKAELKKAIETKNENEKKQQEVTMSITSKYEALMGKDMLDIVKVEQMIQLINEGNAANVSEAINKLRTPMA